MVKTKRGLNSDINKATLFFIMWGIMGHVASSGSLKSWAEMPFILLGIIWMSTQVIELGKNKEETSN